MAVVIYRLFSPICEKFYVGSTSKDVNERLSKHRNKSHEVPNRKVYKYITESGGFTNWEMEIIEIVDEDVRAMREQYWIDTLGAELNSIRCLT